MTLRYKIMAIFIGCITGGFMLLLLCVGLKMQIEKNDLTIDLNTQIIEAKSTEIGLWLSQRISEVAIIAETQEIREMRGHKELITNLNKKLSEKYGNIGLTFAAGRADGLGWVDEAITIDVSEREYFKELMSTEKLFVTSIPVISKADKEPIILICHAVTDKDGNKTGFVNGAISLKKITQIAEEIDFYNGTSWIMDEKGYIYSAENITYVGESENALYRDILARGNTDKYDVGYFEREDEEGRETVVFLSGIPNTNGWTLCTSVEKSQLYTDAKSAIMPIFLMWAAILLLCVVSSAVFIKTITKPIERLSAAMTQVQQGNLQARCKVTGGDEIAVLSGNFNHMADHIGVLIQETYDAQEKKRKAEFHALQAQINPHFLYNTLDTIQWMAYDHNAPEIADIINALSKFFRTALSNGDDVILLKKEVEHAESYLFIQQKRYSNILDFEIIYQEIPEIKVPKLIIQPLVENAIYHGIKPMISKGKIVVELSVVGDGVLIAVRDTGIGMKPERLAAIKRGMQDNTTERKGFGLYNTNQRMKRYYGNEYQIELESQINEGTQIYLKIPGKAKGE